MKIITWNVNGIRACYKKNLMDFVRDEKADLFCVQETKAHVDQVETEARSLGYPFAYWSSASRKGYSGVATFSAREPRTVSKGWGLHEYDSEGRIIISDHEKFLLYNIYFPNGGSGEDRHNYKQKFLKDLNEHLRGVIAGGREVIVVGDYNVARTDIDVFDPDRLSQESGFLPEERAWFEDFLKLGFVDTFRALHPDAKSRYTWWSYKEMGRMGNRGWRIDHICVTRGLEKHLESAEILDQIEGSDHCPAVATFKF